MELKDIEVMDESGNKFKLFETEEEANRAGQIIAACKDLTLIDAKNLMEKVKISFDYFTLN